MNINEVNSYLKSLFKKHNLVNRAIEACKISLNNHLLEYPDEGCSLDETQLRFIQQLLVFEHKSYSTPYVRTYIGLHQIVKGELSEDDSDEYAYYILDTDCDGNCIDDWLICNEHWTKR